jgi:hypothetical protein
MKNKVFLYIGIAVGVAAIAGIEVYATVNQQNNLSDDLVLSQAAEEGSFASPSGMGAELNKEQWHEDPFGDLAKEIREKAGK